MNELYEKAEFYIFCWCFFEFTTRYLILWDSAFMDLLDLTMQTTNIIKISPPHLKAI